MSFNMVLEGHGFDRVDQDLEAWLQILDDSALIDDWNAATSLQSEVEQWSHFLTFGYHMNVTSIFDNSRPFYIFGENSTIVFSKRFLLDSFHY